MTREEQIAVAFDDYSDARKLSTFGDFEYIDIQVAFEEGAEWADANPKSQWISVDDDLPCNHEELIDREIPTYTLYVVVRLKDGTADSSRMIKIPDGNWVWPFKVSHWFPIPKLPKE